MDWAWNTNGKRYKTFIAEDTKRKRLQTTDIVMEDDNIKHIIRMQQYQLRIEREIKLYKQQMRQNDYLQCCRRQG